MLLEELLALPVGTRVIGETELLTQLPGAVASHDDGSHFIRWDDGFSTIPLGKVREYDEYIAGHTQVDPTHGLRVLPKPHGLTNRPTQLAVSGASRVRRT
jgi:hypothetical protein